MINELTVINKLKEIIVRDLGSGFNESNVLIDFPNTLNAPNKKTIYIVPNNSTYTNLSTESDEAEYRVSIFVVCKKDTQDNLTTTVLGVSNSLYELLRTNLDLDETIDFVSIESMEYYTQIEGDKNIRGCEMSVLCSFTKDY